MNRNKHVGELLSGYLDAELTQQESQRVDLHLEQCEDCKKLLEDLQTLKSRVSELSLKSNNTEARETTTNPGVETTRLLGWSLFCVSGLALVCYGIYALFSDPGRDWLEKLAIGTIYAGLILLLASVLRQRLIERRTDKYKDVEI